MAVFQSAEAFLNAADRQNQWLKDQHNPLTFAEIMPIYFLYGHAIELMLKANLRACGFSSQQLRQKYRHNLLELFKASREHLLVMDSHCLSMIGILAAQFSDVDWEIKFRYVTVFRREFPALDAVSVFSRVLLESVQHVCEGKDPLDLLAVPPAQEDVEDDPPL